MNSDTVHMVASDYKYALPVAIAATVLGLIVQRSTGVNREEKRRVISTQFILQNAVFVAAIVAIFMYFGNNSYLENSIKVRPAVI